MTHTTDPAARNPEPGSDESCYAAYEEFQRLRDIASRYENQVARIRAYCLDVLDEDTTDAMHILGIIDGEKWQEMAERDQVRRAAEREASAVKEVERLRREMAALGQGYEAGVTDGVATERERAVACLQRAHEDLCGTPWTAGHYSPGTPKIVNEIHCMARSLIRDGWTPPAPAGEREERAR